MLKSKDEIRQEAREHWQRVIDLLAGTYTQVILDIGYKGINHYKRVKPISPTGIADPPSSSDLDFKLLEPFTGSLRDLLGASVLDYDRFFKPGDLYNILLKARKSAIATHKKQRQQLPTRIKDLKNLKSKLKHRPPSNTIALQSAIDNLIYLHDFSGEFIYYLEHEWPADFGLDKNLDKDPRSQPVWDEILKHFYSTLRNSPEDPFTHTSACKYMAENLGRVFPNIWSGDVEKNANRIRDRIDRLNPKLV